MESTSAAWNSVPAGRVTASLEEAPEASIEGTTGLGEFAGTGRVVPMVSGARAGGGTGLRAGSGTDSAGTVGSVSGSGAGGRTVSVWAGSGSGVAGSGAGR